MSEVHVQTRRPILDHARIDYARHKLGLGFPLRAVAQMVGSSEADLRRIVRPAKREGVSNAHGAAQEPTLSGLPPSVALIIKRVAAAHGVDVARILNPQDRNHPVTPARQQVMWEIYELRSPDSGKRRFSTTGIARILNLKGHSAVSTGIRDHERRLAA